MCDSTCPLSVGRFNPIIHTSMTFLTRFLAGTDNKIFKENEWPCWFQRCLVGSSDSFLESLCSSHLIRVFLLVLPIYVSLKTYVPS